MPFRTARILAILLLIQGVLDLNALLAEGSSPTGQAAPSNDPALIQAKSLLREGRVAEAERIARDFVSAHADSPDGHFLLGLILFRKPDPKGSLAEYTEGARYRVPSGFDLLIVGSDYAALGDFMDADRWFTKSLEFDPSNATTLYYLGRAKYSENRFNESLEIFERCLKTDPKNVKAEENLGLSYQALQQTDQAKDAFHKAIEWQGAQPQDANPFIDMGALLLEGNDADAAVPYLERAASISPEDSRGRMQLGKAYLKLERLQDARRELEKAEQLTPGNASLHYVLAQVYRKEGLSNRASEEFARYSELTGTHSNGDHAGSPSNQP